MTVREFKDLIADVPDEFELLVDSGDEVFCVVQYSAAIVLDTTCMTHDDAVRTSDAHYLYGGHV